jgi:hypothetical protein
MTRPLYRPSPAYPRWLVDDGSLRIRFIGRGPAAERAGVLRAIGEREPRSVSWLRQVHGARVVDATPGFSGEADALGTARTGLALAVSTADCVPVVVATGDRVALAHAGWRGLVAGVLASLASTLGEGGRAWIGPSIGACCYEIDDEVAEKLIAVSRATVVRPAPGPRPHVDLQAVAAAQLTALGIDIRGRVEVCTRCHGDLLFSYRREGRRAGRNLTFAWRTTRA